MGVQHGQSFSNHCAVKMEFKSNYPPVEIPKDDLVPYFNEKGELKGYYLEVENVRISAHMVKSGMIPDPRVNFYNIKEMTIFDDDILICAGGKAGTHWLWEVVSMIVKGISDYEPRSKESTMLDFHVPEDFDNIARPRVLNTHLPFNLLPKRIIEKRCKILYLQRNPKDMMVSGFNHLKKMVPPNAPPLLWEDWLHYLFTGQSMGVGWHKHKKGYEDVLEERSDHILPLFYEDLKKDLEAEIKKIADFLQVQCSDDLAGEIADKCTFKNLKEADRKKKHMFEADMNFLYRKGEVGDWKNWFTVAQNERMDQFIAENTKESRFEYQYTI